jgi:lipopolysaccharide transport system permease protein
MIGETAGAAPRTMTNIEPGAHWSMADLRELWASRELLGFLIWRDVKVRYQQTVMGFAWAVVQPVVPMVLFTVIFGRIAKLPSENVPYPLFTLAGLIGWQVFASSLSGASSSLVGSAGLITKVYFPRVLIPLAAVGASLVDFMVSLVVVFALMAWYGVSLTAAVIALPLFVLFAVVTALAVALWTSALNVRYRDVQHVMPFLIQVWLLASPVAYSMSLITSPRWRVVYALNPMAGVIQGFRSVLLGTPWAPATFAPSLLVTAGLLLSGLWYFRRTEDSFADVI